MGIASYIVLLRTHTQKKSFFFSLLKFFFFFAMEKKKCISPFHKKPPSRKYAKSKYHQSLLHATEPQATTALEHLSYFEIPLLEFTP